MNKNCIKYKRLADNGVMDDLDWGAEVPNIDYSQSEFSPSGSIGGSNKWINKLQNVDWQNTGSKVANFIRNIKTSAAQRNFIEPQYKPAPITQKPNYKPLLIGGGVLLVGVIIAISLRNKNKK